jgi:potassium voltage-gated channel Shaw-related subfamily C member 1
MTYTRHRDTRETLQILDRLDLDSDKPTDEEIMHKFGLDEQFRTSSLNCWQKIRPKIWLLFEEPNSTLAAKVSNSLCLIEGLVVR